MFHIRPNKASLYVARVAAIVTSALDKNVQQDRYLSSPRRKVVDTAAHADRYFGKIDIL